MNGAARPRSDGHGPPILVTGMPRAATSWVGKLLDASGRVVYINEPMNPRHPPGGSPGVLRMDIAHRFLYITDENEQARVDPVRDMLELRYHPLAELAANRSPYDLGRLVKYWSSFTRGRIGRRRALLDDPFAVMSTEWLTNRFGCHPVVIVRHPAAIISSRLRLGHRFDFEQLLAQPLLMRDWLAPFAERMREMTTRPDDVVGQGSLLWAVIYHVVDALRARVPNLVVVRHEDLATDPVPRFRELFASLAVPFTADVEQEVMRSTSGGDASHSHSWSISRRGISRTGYRPRDSRVLVGSWKRALSAEDVARIRDITADVAPRYYSEDDW